MDSTTLLIAAVAIGAGYYFYTKQNQNDMNAVMYAKHDKPMDRHKVGGMLSAAKAKFGVPGQLNQYDPLGALEDRYINNV